MSEEVERLRRIHQHAKDALRRIGIDPDQHSDDGGMPPTVGEHILALGEHIATLERQLAELRQDKESAERITKHMMDAYTQAAAERDEAQREREALERVVEAAREEHADEMSEGIDMSDLCAVCRALVALNRARREPPGGEGT